MRLATVEGSEARAKVASSTSEREQYNMERTLLGKGVQHLAFWAVFAQVRDAGISPNEAKCDR